MLKAIFYHAGCPVCVEAESQILGALDKTKYNLEVVHLGKAKNKIADAEKFGVKSVPALVLGNTPFHINFGANISDLKK